MFEVLVHRAPEVRRLRKIGHHSPTAVAWMALMPQKIEPIVLGGPKERKAPLYYVLYILISKGSCVIWLEQVVEERSGVY